VQVLAKEIKSLRASQMEAKQEAKQAMQAKVAMEVRIAQHFSDVNNFLVPSESIFGCLGSVFDSCTGSL